MSTLIIGGDNLHSIQHKLKQRGFDKIVHVSGRNGWDKKLNDLLRSSKVDVIIILVDYVNHCVVYNSKKILKSSNVKTIFTKRAWSHLETHINNLY
jgi:hypothetical protein